MKNNIELEEPITKVNCQNHLSSVEDALMLWAENGN